MPQPHTAPNTGDIALIALGGNLGSTHGMPKENLHRALSALETMGIDITAVSRFYRTPCFPPGAGPDFVNAAAMIVTHFAPDVLLTRLHAVEAQLGRERTSRWEARVVDLDLLAVGDLILPDAVTLDHWIGLPPEVQAREAPTQLILPHPRLQDRGFVLVPLADIAPDWRHPRLGRSVTEMLADLPDGEIDGIVPL